MGSAPNPDYAATIPQQTFMIYQLMFAIITPALISGAFAERMKFSAMLLFTTLWMLVVYFPMAHMVWGKGGLLNAAAGRQDSRASISRAARWCTSPPASRRWSARCTWASASAIPHEPMKPHNLVLSFIGACLLWVGWFGFNAGSALAASGLATSAFVATHFGAAAGGPGVDVRRVDAITASPACWAASPAAWPDWSPSRRLPVSCKPFPALLIGLLRGSRLLSSWWPQSSSKFGYDDSLDAFGVHGCGGTLGALLTGVFATNRERWTKDAVKGSRWAWWTAMPARS